ncbi:MAG: hypothetical protein QOF95_484 [Pseudonocardiales bacterium]|nr:hypothetical protein [Pseudonocardiales bacterium]
MNDYEPTSPHETPPAGSSGGAGTAPPFPPASSPDSSAPVPMTPRRKIFGSRKLTMSIAAGVAVIALGTGGYAIASSGSGSSTTAASSSSATVPGKGAGGGPLSGGGGSNARSGPAAGGSSGTVATVSTSGFTLTTAAGQKVTVTEASSTTYLNGTSAASASAVTTGVPVLVLGTTNGTTITATQVTVLPASASGSTTYSPSPVASFQQGAPSAAKQDGQIPANYTEGSGTIVSGTTANKATEAALAAYPGGVVDRVVQLSNGEYEVHYIGVNWPHHIFVNQSFQVVGAN